MKFKKISYEKLKPRQQENYNYHKISSKLADYGYTTIRLTNDTHGADFLLQHVDTSREIVKVQLKGRWTVNKNYQNKNLYIAFRKNNKFYLCPHDQLLDFLLNKKKKSIKNTSSWLKDGHYNSREISVVMMPFFKNFEIK